MALDSVSFAEAILAEWSALGSAYYRPLTSLVLWLSLRLYGHDPAPYYAVSVALHGVNGWLLWHVARRQGGAVLASCAALAWLVFPTHFEAVAYVAALVHPLSTLFVLLAILAYDQALTTGHTRWWLATVGMILLAPLAHEQAIILPALLIGWQLLMHPPARVGQWFRSPTPYLVMLMIPTLGLRALMGGTFTATVSPGLENSGAGAQHVAALIAYPLAWCTGGLPGGPAALVVLGLSLASLIVWVCYRHERLRSALAALGWLLATAAPMVLLVEAENLLSSPRLFYLPSIGIALLWGCLPAALLRRPLRRTKWPHVAIMAAWGILVCLAPLAYIRCALSVLARGSAIVREIVVAAQTVPDDGRGTFVNVPFYFVDPCGAQNLCEAAFPYSSAGMVLLPLYSQLSDLVRVNGGPERVLDSVSYAGFEPDWATHGAQTSALAIRHALDQDELVFAVQLSETRVLDLTSEWAEQEGVSGVGFLRPLLAPPEIATPSELETARPLAVRWDSLVLSGEIVGPSGLPGDELPVSLFWRPQDEHALLDANAILRLRDRYGSVLVEEAFPVLAGYSPNLWKDAVTYVTSRQIPIPANAALGPARVELGLYRDDKFLNPSECADCDSAGWIVVDQTLVGREQVVAAMDDGATPVGARWENGIRLEGWLMTGPSATGEAGIILYWSAEQSVTEDLTVFLHLADASGTPLAQDDGEPCEGQYPTSRWPAGALVADSRTVQLPEDDYPTLDILVGLYRWPSLERLAVAQHGDLPADHLVLTEVEPVQH